MKNIHLTTVSRLQLVLACVIFVACSTVALGGLAPQNDAESKAQARLAWIREHEPGMWNVAPGEGAFLREQVEKVGAKHALEIGTSNGYSGIWIALGLRKSGGYLVTLEIDEERARLAQENFKAAGVDSLVTLVRGDAHQEIPKLNGSFDFVFIDAEKSGYLSYLRAVEPKVPPGGEIVAHNVTDLRSSLEDFIHAVETDRLLKTTFVNAGPGGFSMSVRLP